MQPALELAAGVEPLDHPHPDSGGGDRGFVVMDLGVGDAGMVVKDGVDIGLAHQRVPVFVSGLVGVWRRCFLALPSADIAPASAVRDVAELLHIDVQHRARMVMLVAANRLP
ncbi:hypothetical protein HMPREF3149_04470 [Corynebacterium sp. HMSC05E07]|nr:hypothetical protein HMPREF3149_04470 [Corynebacterium sp. HMSC05E07]